jgi:hypothetical protein
MRESFLFYSLNMDNLSVTSDYCFHDDFAHGRMGMDGLDDFVACGFDASP